MFSTHRLLQMFKPNLIAYQGRRQTFDRGAGGQIGGNRKFLKLYLKNFLNVNNFLKYVKTIIYN